MSLVSDHDPALQGLDPGTENGVPERDVQNGLVVVRPALGTMLVEAGLVTSEQIRTAMDESTSTDERFGEVLLRHGWVSETDLARTIARQWNLPFLDDSEVTVDPRASLLISPTEAHEAGVFPLGFNEQRRTLVAVADPTEGRLDQLRAILGGQVAFGVVTVGTLRRLYDTRPPEPADQVDGDDSAPAGLHEPSQGDGSMGDVAETDMHETAESVSDTPEPEHTSAANGTVELDALSADFDLGAEAIARARARVGDLVRELHATQSKLGESERLLAETVEARENERERLAQLETSVGQRDSFIASLRSKFSELDGSIDTTP